MPDRRPTAGEHLRAIVQLNSDGCTLAPDLNIRRCCERHDYYYRHSGKFRYCSVTRREADRLLLDCMQAQDYRFLAWVYWAAVRLFGWWFWNANR
jgi:hypothetical protein